MTYGTTAALGHAPGDVPLGALDVGENGRLHSLTDVAVEVRRDNNVIDNAGTITGGGGGIDYVAGVVEGRLSNAGTISSFLGNAVAAVGAVGGGTPGLFEIVNTGAIDAAADGVSIGNESLQIANHGSIVAGGTGVRVADDPGLDNSLVLVNTGLIQGETAAVDATDHDDSISNGGTLLGAVLLGAGDNRFDNAGIVTGAVSAGAGADTIDNAGAISAQ